MRLSLVVPCYNEEGNIELMYDAVKNAFSKVDYDYEIIFVNDGSKDNTIKKLKELNKRDELNVKVVNFSRNFGKESAMYAGLKESVGDYVTVIDADLQQRPETVVEMVEILDNNEDYDAVAAFQKERGEGKVLTFFKNCFYKLINKMTEIEFKEGASDFRTFRRSVVNSILEMTEYYRFSKGIFSWIGYNTHFMEYKAEERATGTSKWSFWKLFKYALDGIIAFTTVPLRVATLTGVVTSIVAVIYMLVVIIQKLCFSIVVPGYATIVVLILLLGGLQLFALGIIGEYLARNYVETKRRPIYIAKEIIDYKKED